MSDLSPDMTGKLERLLPRLASDILRDAIEARRDAMAARAVLDREADMRAALVAKLGGGDD